MATLLSDTVTLFLNGCSDSRLVLHVDPSYPYNQSAKSCWNKISYGVDLLGDRVYLDRARYAIPNLAVVRP